MSSGWATRDFRRTNKTGSTGQGYSRGQGVAAEGGRWYGPQLSTQNIKSPSLPGKKGLWFYKFNAAYCCLASHSEAFRCSREWLANSVHPGYSVLPEAPLPSSAGDESVITTTRPVP